ncbi:hypothetical protein EYR40_008247 [Pleurotus pulmonarius]|nr:hypothetical protein EYR36_009069 [Pleurotus pulmonarius]KAF4597780.1 hypothetical protein EYR40_008247 [Pleurotus pulmonarius]
MPPPYNIHQQVWSIGLASNIGCLGTESELQHKMDRHLQSSIDEMKIGPWEVVWGPSIWKLEPDDAGSGADHSWFVARNPAADWGNEGPRDTYVISIAGTANKSDVDFHEDVDVDRVVDFESFAGAGVSSPPVPAARETIDPLRAYIALGTANGVHHLLTVASAGQKTTLPQFLGSIPAGPTTSVVFTGHSLGAALSPTLALTALKSGILRNIPLGNTFAYPAAGPSPGNRPFAALYAESLPLITVGPSAYQVWNANIWNKYDIVPHAWNIGSVQGQNLWDLLWVYGKLNMRVTLEASAAIIYEMMRRIVPSGIDYVPIQGSMICPSTPPATPQTIQELFDNAGPQHVHAYVEVIGAAVPSSPCESSPSQRPPIIQVLEDAVRKSSKNEDRAL